MPSPILCTCLTLACLCALTGAGETGAGESPQPPTAESPFFQLREHQTDYAGPGRDDPSPEQLHEILLGYFGPSDPAHPEGGDLWLAAQLAVEEANQEGGCRGKPLRIVPGWSENPWGTGVRQVVRMAYTDKVWAVVGGIDGPSTHLAEQVVAKARLLLLSPASTDKSVNLANVPWMFSLVPGDHLQAPVLAAAAFRRVGSDPFLLVSANDHDSHLFTVELRRCLAARRMAPRYDFQCSRAGKDVARTVSRIVASKPAAVVLVAGADQSARLVAGLREQGFTGLIFGGPAMGRRRFPQEAGDAAEGVLFPLLYDPQERSGEFAKAFQGRCGQPPDYAAAHTYDAFRLLVAAIRKAGLNRAGIRDAIQALSPYSGVTGTVTWDRLGSNTRPVALGTIRNGRIGRAAEASKPSVTANEPLAY